MVTYPIIPMRMVVFLNLIRKSSKKRLSTVMEGHKPPLPPIGKTSKAKMREND